ncbi:tetratricopeptide repeat protein [Paracoccaceae bacterium]|nr:tetratricopeptide repeat protein [Paracoccaceae bacterium]
MDLQFSKAFYNMAKTFFAFGDTAAAIDIYKKSIALKPEFAPASNNLCAAYLKAGQISEAFQSFARALRLNPQHE